MSLEQGILLAVVIVASAVIAELLRRFRQARIELRQATEERDHERNQRLVYERALGLPIFSAESRDADLWARAAQGDEIAALIIEERLSVELFGQFEPEVLNGFDSSGDSNTQGTPWQGPSSRS